MAFVPSSHVIPWRTVFAKKAAIVAMLILLTDLNTFSTDAVKIVVGKDSDQDFEADWTDGVCYAPIPDARIGDTIEFIFNVHNVYRMPNMQAFQDCDFSEATELSGVGQSPYEHTITEDDAGKSIFFACQVGGHCFGNQKVRVNVGTEIRESLSPDATPESKFGIGVNANLCNKVHTGEAELGDVLALDERTTECSDPVSSVEKGTGRKYYHTTCLSKPFTFTPGGVINQAEVVHFPFPKDRRVLQGTRSWEFVQGDPETGLQNVYVNQLYVHHILGGVVRGNGAESIRRFDEDAAFTLPFGELTGDFDDVMAFHLIDLRETGDKWLECAECRCTTKQAEYTNNAGSIACCSNCTDLLTPTVDYRMRYNVSWTELSDLDVPVRPLMILHADIAPVLGLVIEFDVPPYKFLPADQRLDEDPTVQVLKRVGTIGTIFSKNFPGAVGDYSDSDIIEIHRCTGHMHIGGLRLFLEDLETGEIICSSDATYGTDAATDLGFITSLSVTDFDVPRIVSVNQKVQLVSHYNASELHTGVMGLLQLSVLEPNQQDIGPEEAMLNVDICNTGTCDASKVPEWCTDNIETGQLCQYTGICSCETLLQLPSDTMTGCGGVLKLGSRGDIPVDYFCAKSCGCSQKDDKDAVISSLESVIEEEKKLICRYNDEGCTNYLSNIYSCSQGMPGVDDLEDSLKAAIIENGENMAINFRKLGNPYMHRYEQTSGSTLTKCSGTDAGTIKDLVDETVAISEESVSKDTPESSDEVVSKDTPESVKKDDEASDGFLASFHMAIVALPALLGAFYLL